MRDQQEKKLTEKLIARTEEFLKAVQKKDVKAMKAMLDRMTFGDLTDTAGTEPLPRIFSIPADLLGWDLEDVQVRMHGFGLHTGTSSLNYRFKGPAGEFKTQGQPIHWIFRNSDNTWYITRAPRSK
jgi:ketosteroid isomerase-like protein